MDSKRHDPSKIENGSRGGRTKKNALKVDWQSRAEDVWKVHPYLKREINELHDIAHRLDPRTIGVYEDFRRKFNGTRPANERHARILFQAGEFDRAGITYSDWIASNEEWALRADCLSPIDVISFLTKRAANGKVVIAAKSTPGFRPTQWRRLRDGDVPDNELHIEEYLQLTVTFSGSIDPRPVYLLALEWSAKHRDWQIFNFVKGSQLNIDRPEPVVVSDRDAVAQISVGVRISGPPEPFDLFVLCHRTPFDHTARAYLDNLGRRATLTSLEMSLLVQLLFGGLVEPDVAMTAYTVVD